MREKTDATVFEFPESPLQRKKRYLWVWSSLTAVVVIILAAIMAILYFSPVLATKTITTTGNHLLTEDQVVQKLGELEGIPLTQITDRDVEKLLVEESAISSSKIQVHLPDTLIVHLIEYDPVVIVQSGGKTSRIYELYNSLGQSIKTLKDKEEADNFKLPVIAKKATTENEAVFATITKVLGDVDGELRSKMSSAEAETIDSVVLKLKDGREIFWGNAKDNESKLVVLSALMKSEDQRQKGADEGKIKNHTPAKVFDVSTPDQPVLR